MDGHTLRVRGGPELYPPDTLGGGLGAERTRRGTGEGSVLGSLCSERISVVRGTAEANVNLPGQGGQGKPAMIHISIY